MFKDGHSLRCVLCDVLLEIPDGSEPKIHVEGTSGQPNVRVLSIDGIEFHRCETTIPDSLHA